jgi:hypothetical protein
MESEGSALLVLKLSRRFLFLWALLEFLWFDGFGFFFPCGENVG